jgi:hypothetical protein
MAVKKSRDRVITILMAALLVGAVGAESGPGAPVRLTLDLTDGSRVIGIPTVVELRLRTSLGGLVVPLKAARHFRVRDDRESVTFTFRNEDVLTGVPDIDEIVLATVFGRAAVPLRHVMRVRVARLGAAAPANAGLVLHLAFDEAADPLAARDKSGTGNHGIVQGAVWVAAPRVDGAHEFRGNARVVVPDNPSLHFQDFTVCVWLKTTAASTRHLLEKDLPGTGTHDYELDVLSTGTVLFQIGVGGSTWGATSEAVVNDGDWHCVVGRRTSESVDLWIDGEPAASAPAAAGPVAGAGEPLTIGHGWRGGFVGAIGEVRMYSRALDDAEIRGLAAQY